MSYRNPMRSVTGGLSGGILLLGLALSFAFGGFNLVIFFIALAFTTLIGSFSSRNPRGVSGGLIGAMWMIMLALFFATGSWLWFLVGAALSAIISAFIRPLTAFLLGLGTFGLASTDQQPQQPYYQPTPNQQSYPSQPQQYQQGYQPTPQTEGYQEGGQRYSYPGQQAPQQQYEQPQAQYPQEMPPQQ